jgi:hypothetical protein
MQQVGQQPSSKMFRWLRICRLQCPAIIALITTNAKRALVVDIRVVCRSFWQRGFMPAGLTTNPTQVT